MKDEKTLKATNGYKMFAVLIAVIAGMITGFILTENPLFAILGMVMILIIKGFFTINPNSSKVMVLF